ncbi:MAG: PEP-CTERM sorting domain-containing protein [bacterium]
MRVISALAALSLVASTAAAQSFGGYQMQLNGSGGNGTPLISGGALQLINDDYGSSSSAFTTGTFDFSALSAWSTSFRLHYAFTSDVNGWGVGGDGIAFVMQSGAATATGVGGGSMGYEGINNSIAVAFRSFWDDVLIGENGVLNGASPFIANSAGLSTGSSGPSTDFFAQVLLSYDGAGGLSLSYTPTSGSGVFSATHAVDVSSLGSTVRLGFTGGSGSATQLAEVDNWSVTGLSPTTVTPEPASMVLMATGIVVVVGAARRRKGESAKWSCSEM